MIKDPDRFRNVLKRNSQGLAFILGNGINRYAYGNAPGIAWEEMLLDIWGQVSHRTLTGISEGISLTEFYDILEFEAGSMADVRNRVVAYYENWLPTPYHDRLRDNLIEWNVPVLTTNFDRNLESGLSKYRMDIPGSGFTDYYPWNVYYGTSPLTHPLAGFGIWHINGMLEYRRSLRLSLTEYTHLCSRSRAYLHSADRLDKYDPTDPGSMWNGLNTWLHVIFGSSLCVCGLGLDENEIFLRWLLIERMKYFRRFPARKKKGWYVCKNGNDPDGKRFFLDYLGFEMVRLEDYGDIYDGIFEK